MEKCLILGVSQEKHKMNLNLLIVPDSEEAPKKKRWVESKGYRSKPNAALNGRHGNNLNKKNK